MKGAGGSSGGIGHFFIVRWLLYAAKRNFGDL